MSDPNKFRSRLYVAVLYPEDDSHKEAVEKLQANGYNFAAILHDKDVYEDGENKGELKKPHWHIVLRFKNAVYNTAIAKELGIERNYLEACKDQDSSLLYLVHYGKEDKAQYDYEEVFGPMKLKLASLLADTDEGTRILNIVDIVESSPGPISCSELLKKAVAAGLYADLRRMGHLATTLVREHNYEIWYQSQSNAGVAQDFEHFNEFIAFTGDKDIKPL